MDKGVIIKEHIDNIILNIEFDKDVVALEKLFTAMLEIDLKESLKNWKKFLYSYDIINNRKDIDFIPLLYIYPLNILKKTDSKNFFEILNNIPSRIKKLIFSLVFNVYDDNYGVWEIIKKLIISQKFGEEKDLIYNILFNSKEFPEVTFDTNEFLNKIILLHINMNVINLDLLFELANIPQVNKEKSLLHALLIDYI